MAGFANRPSFAGHTNRSAKTDHELTSTPDHQMGAGHNITEFRVNVATRATDIDSKHVEVISDKAEAQVESFILNLKNRDWMKERKFPVFLNRMGHTRAKYGVQI